MIVRQRLRGWFAVRSVFVYRNASTYFIDTGRAASSAHPSSLEVMRMHHGIECDCIGRFHAARANFKPSDKMRFWPSRINSERASQPIVLHIGYMSPSARIGTEISLSSPQVCNSAAMVRLLDYSRDIDADIGFRGVRSKDDHVSCVNIDFVVQKAD